MTDASPPPVLTHVENGVGRIQLNRPSALNALTLPMVEAITAALDAWREQPLRMVLVESASPRAFCAGGDIRAVRQNTLDGHPERSEAFFAAEYAMNLALATYPHPVVALVDGVCMGGGLGLSVHGPYRVVTERTVMAMPETAIGFFPDIGASYFLPRLPGAIGMYLGLTGTRVNGADAVRIGLGTHLVSSADIGALTQVLIDGGEIAATLDSFGEDAWHGSAPTPVADARDQIDRTFAGTGVPEIRAALTAASTEWAADQVAVLDRMSPASLEVTFDLITRGRDRTLAECLQAELVATRAVTSSPDFVEGVRAVLVDKDHSPRWART